MVRKLLIFRFETYYLHSVGSTLKKYKRKAATTVSHNNYTHQSISIFIYSAYSSACIVPSCLDWISFVVDNCICCVLERCIMCWWCDGPIRPRCLACSNWYIVKTIWFSNCYIIVRRKIQFSIECETLNLQMIFKN